MESSPDCDWFLLQNSVVNTNKPGKCSRVLNGAVKFDDAYFDNLLLTETGLLQNLI